MSMTPLEIGGSGGSSFLPYLVLRHIAWISQKGMSTLLGTMSMVQGMTRRTLDAAIHTAVLN